MTTKKTTERKTAKKRRSAKAVQKLSKKARDEIIELAKHVKARIPVYKLSKNAHAEIGSLVSHVRAGTITRIQLERGLKELETGLQEVDDRLKRMINHVYYFL
jgi:hypothetical protein